MSKSRIFVIHNLFSALILRNLLEMIMLISWIGTTTQARMGGCMVEFPSKGPIRGKKAFL